MNYNTPATMCTVHYPGFLQAVNLCLNEGKICKCAKSDWKSAFRHFPILPKFWKFLVLKACSQLDHRWYYFVDKCMPFGASISCAHFQAFSDAISHILRHKTGKENVNYLDDFLFTALWRWLCNQQVETFLGVCRTIRFPVSMEKTVWVPC